MMTLDLKFRKDLEKLLKKGIKIKEICRRLQKPRSTIHRELKKCKRSYNAQEAHNNTCKGFHPIDWSIKGRKFDRLTVLEYVGYNNAKIKRTMWKCQCDCGAITYMSRKQLLERKSKTRELSCGCDPKESIGKIPVPLQEAQYRKYLDLLKFRKIKGDCWEWTGYKQQGKMPKTSWKNKAMGVRKCVYLLFNDTMYEPNPVFAKCGNLLCFNPDHITIERPKKRIFYDSY